MKCCIIWYVEKFKDWAIGDLENIGGKKRGISSVGDQGDKLILGL